MGPEEANRGELEGGRWWWWQGRCRTIKIAAIVLQRFCFVAVKVGAAATVPYGLCGFVLEPVFLLGRYMITCRGCSVVVLHHGILPTIRRCCSRVLPGDFSLKGDGRGPCMATRGSAVCFSLSGCVEVDRLFSFQAR